MKATSLPICVCSHPARRHLDGGPCEACSECGEYRALDSLIDRAALSSVQATRNLGLRLKREMDRLAVVLEAEAAVARQREAKAEQRHRDEETRAEIRALRQQLRKAKSQLGKPARRERAA